LIPERQIGQPTLQDDHSAFLVLTNFTVDLVVLGKVAKLAIT
jgi:hypothetical protein